MCWITSRLNLLWVPLKSSHLTPPLFFQDTLQINKGSGPTRYRLRMSDGRHLWSGKYLKLSSLAVMLIQRMIELIYFIFQRCTFVCVCVLCAAFLLATQLNHLSEEKLLVPHCVCLLKKTTTSTLSDGRYVFICMCPPSSLLPLQYVFATFLYPFRRVVIILDMEILQSAEKSGGLIGNPTTYKESMIFIL